MAETRWEGGGMRRGGGGTRIGEKDHPTSHWTHWVLHNVAGTRWWGMAETRWEGGGTRGGEKDHPTSQIDSLGVVECRRVVKTPNKSLDLLGVA